MRPGITSEMASALSSTESTPVHFLVFHFSAVERYVTTPFPISYDLGDGAQTYAAGSQILGFGDVTETEDMEIGTMVFRRSAVDQTSIASVLLSDPMNAKVDLYLGLLDANNSVIPSPIRIYSGRVKSYSVDESPGGQSVLSIATASVLADFKRTAGRRTSAADQQIYLANTRTAEGASTTSSSTFLVDSSAQFITGSRVLVGGTVTNVTAGFSGTITAIISDTQLICTLGASDVWTSGDVYEIAPPVDTGFDMTLNMPTQVLWGINPVITPAKAAFIKQPNPLDPAASTGAAVAFLPIAYGVTRLPGQLTYISEAGASNEYLWMVYSVCDADRGINAVSSIEIEDSRGTTAVWGPGVLPGTPYSNYIEVLTTDGTHNSQPFPQLVTETASSSNPWLDSHLQAGVATVAIRLKYASSVFSGIPNFVFRVLGEEVLDIDQLPTEVRESSWDYPDCIFDYLTNAIYGKGLSTIGGEDIDLASFVSAKAFYAQISDRYIGGPPDARHSLHASLDTSDTIIDNLEKLKAGCRAHLVYSSGLFSLLPERHYDAYLDYGLGTSGSNSYFEFNEENISGSWGFSSGDISERYNRVKVAYTNTQQRDATDYAAVESVAFRQADGRLLESDLSIPVCPDVYQAMALASMEMRTSRHRMEASFDAFPEAIRVRPGTLVYVTHQTPGWVQKLFRVTKLVIKADGMCRVTVREHYASDYDLSTPNEVVIPTQTSLPDPMAVPDVVGLTLASGDTTLTVAPDGTLTARILVSWMQVDNVFVTGYEIEFKRTVDSVWIPAGFAGSADTVELYIAGVVEGVSYDVRIRAVNALAKGEWATESNYVVEAHLTAPSAPSSPALAGDFRSVILSWTPPADYDFYSVEIQRSYTPDQNDATTIAETSATTYTDTGLDVGQTAYYWIRAVDTSGNASGWTSVGSAAPVQITQADAPEIYGLATTLFADASDSASAQALELLLQARDETVARVAAVSAEAAQRSEDVAREAATAAANLLSEATARNAQIIDAVAAEAATRGAAILSEQTARVDADSAIASDVTALQVTVNDASTGVVATATGLSDLTTRVDTAEGTISSHSTTITSLQSQINALAIDPFNSATTYAIDDKFTYLEVIYKVIATQTPPNATPPNATYYEVVSDYTTLADTVAANSSAISALDTRVTSAEGTITSHSASITTLQSDLTTAEGDILANAGAISSLDTRTTAAEGSITTNASDITALETIVNHPTTGVAANATAVSSLDSRVTTAEGAISTNASDITALETTVNDPSTGVAATATAVSTLDSRVDQTELDIAAGASSITSIQAGVGIGLDGTIDDIAILTLEALLNQYNQDAQFRVSLATATESLTTDITTQGEAISAATLSLQSQVNANVASIQTESLTRASADAAAAADILALQADVGTNSAAITAESVARASADAAAAADILALQADVGTNSAAITAESVARASGDSALSSSITSLTTTVSGNTSSISANLSSINGIRGEYSIGIDVNGFVSGYSLISELVDSGAVSSEFKVSAGAFLVGDAAVEEYPFKVYTSPTVVNGETIAAGTYIEDAMIHNAMITTLKLDGNAVTVFEVSTFDGTYSASASGAGPV